MQTGFLDLPQFTRDFVLLGLHFPNEGNEGIHYPVVVGPEQLVSELEVSCDNFAVWDFPLKISYVEAVDICD
jgi:hypothetical protein